MAWDLPTKCWVITFTVRKPTSQQETLGERRGGLRARREVRVHCSKDEVVDVWV